MNENTEQTETQATPLTTDQIRAILKGNFSTIIEGFKTFSELNGDILKDNNKETLTILEEEVFEFVQLFELARRQLGLNLMEISMALEKNEGRPKDRRIGFTSGLKDKETA